MKRFPVIVVLAMVVLLVGVGIKNSWTKARQAGQVPPIDFIVQPQQPAALTQQTPESHQKLFIDNKLEKLKLLPGFNLAVFAQVPDARSLAVSPSGIVFVSNRQQGRVYALVDDTKDGFADRVLPIAEKLDTPNGVALKDGDLYVATISKVLKFANIEKRLTSPPQPETIYDNYPVDKHHGWKFIAFGPDGKLYVPVGAPCNICLKDNPRYASITRLDVNTKQMEIIASGIRNTVGFDWHPDTKQLWFTDNGRDQMGDDQPTDELNVVTGLGQHFGYPFCHQGNIQDPDISPKRSCSNFISPALNLSPHAAALGMRFYTGSMFPAEYQKRIFIAEHGSWNRSTPIGYRVMEVNLDDSGKATSYQPFVEGWLQDDGTVLGRPVDVAVWTDGSLLISDDKAGLVYRVTYQK